jgi:proteasome lid subunit RPN8/RPN11
MIILLSHELLGQIRSDAERCYPDEGAGFLLGRPSPERLVSSIMTLPNVREEGARQRRYLLGIEDYRKAESEADRRGMMLVGVFHSHPDHPNIPSAFDREWAQPFFSYIITTVEAGRAGKSRSWRLAEDRSEFLEETIQIQ